MASNERTPASVLNAPKSEPTVVWAAYALSRDERRGRVRVTTKRLRHARQWGQPNVPFVGKVRDLL